MGKHYIPRYYLRGFLPPGSKLIWVCETGRPLPVLRGLPSIAQETHFYTDEVEEILTNEFENPAQPVIDKIRQRQLPGPDERIVLAKYMTAMLKRVPESKRRIQSHAPQVASDVRARIFQRLDDAAQKEPERKDHFGQVKSGVDELLLNYERQVPEEFWLAAISPDLSPNIVNAFAAMTWQFWVCDKRPAFVTSDNPVFYFDSVGIGNQESEVVFPISSQIALWATWRIDVSMFRPANLRIIREINNRLVREATRFVFAPFGKKWLATLLNQQERIVLNRIV